MADNTPLPLPSPDRLRGLLATLESGLLERATEVRLPQLTEGHDAQIVAQAEVEL